MFMIEKNIPLSPDKALLFVGARDQHLKLMETIFNCKIYLSDSEVSIRGEPENVEIAEKSVSNFISKLNNNIFKNEKDILNYLNNSIHYDSNDDNLIISTPSGKVFPRSEGQKEYIKAMNSSELTICIGPAGTGKTYLAVAKAVELLIQKEVKKIILTRPAVEAGENLGFLPGDFIEKVQPYLQPLYDALFDTLTIEKTKKMIEAEVIEVAPLAFMRGRTLNNAFIILDEAQNTTPAQMKMFLTRLGKNSQTVVCGDITQSDLISGTSGLSEVAKLFDRIEEISITYLTLKDVVRHRLVKVILQAYHRQQQNEK